MTDLTQPKYVDCLTLSSTGERVTPLCMDGSNRVHVRLAPMAPGHRHRFQTIRVNRIIIQQREH